MTNKLTGLPNYLVTYHTDSGIDRHAVYHSREDAESEALVLSGLGFEWPAVWKLVSIAAPLRKPMTTEQLTMHPLCIYPTDPEAQRQWVEDSIASRLADLKAKTTGPRPKQEKNQ